MMAELLWKEHREHRSIWVALALLGAGGLVGIPLAYEPSPGEQETFRDLLGILALVVAWTYGLVCGGMLLAGEREAGTQAFLDMLPTDRLPLWLGKAMTGGLFLALQLALLAGVAGWQGFYPDKYPVASVLGLLAAGLSGYAWGLLFSAYTSTVIGAIGLTILAHLVLLPLLNGVMFVVAAIFGTMFGFPFVEQTAVALTALTWLVLPLPLSALHYSKTDFTRHPMVPVRVARAASARPSGQPSWDRLWWLAWQQTRGLAGGLLLFCVAAGMILLGPGVVLWPLLTLGIGAFCGATLFLDEQSGPYRFLGEQRFPLGRLWLVKVVMRITLLLLALLVVLLPAIIVQFAVATHGGDPRDETPLLRLRGPFLGRSFFLFLFLWPAYGFAVGHLCGLLFRKPLVALVVAFGLAALLSGIWGPSLVSGGLWTWQVTGVPLVLIAAGYLVLRPWAQDRLVSWDIARPVIAAGVLCPSLILLGLWYRIAEIPDVPVPADFAAFVAGLPTVEQNESGRQIRGACFRLDELRRQWQDKRAEKPLFPDGGPVQGGDVTLVGQANEVVRRGWPDDAAWLAGALDELFADDWWRRLAEAARKPVGVVEDPRNLTIHSPLRGVDGCQLAGVLLPARGLQMQKTKGDPAVFVDHLAIALALVRNLQNHAIWPAAAVARRVESLQVQALQRWLEQLDGRPDLLARVVALLTEHEASLPADDHEQRLAEYLVALNSLERPGEWLPLGLGAQGGELSPSGVALVESAWRLPWEEARNRRMLRAMHWDPSYVQTRGNRLDLLWLLGPRHFNRPRQTQEYRDANFAAAILKAALRRFQAETGKPAQRLAQLVPKYLERIPSDPFDGQPFRYRLSQGEEIAWPGGWMGDLDPVPPPVPLAPGMPPAGEDPRRWVPAGQGILWSVSEDGKDDGGKRQRGDSVAGSVGQDLIYLVPLPRKNRH
jgi:hypothetical protein